jgi:hypothetical protein
MWNEGLSDVGIRLCGGSSVYGVVPWNPADGFLTTDEEREAELPLRSLPILKTL